jgi:TRAP-type C4-dicarboxylate transport system permease small subunit
MRDVDAVDLVLHVLPPRARKIVVLIVLLLFGGQAVTWYAEQKAAEIQEQMIPVLEHLATPTPSR